MFTPVGNPASNQGAPMSLEEKKKSYLASLSPAVKQSIAGLSGTFLLTVAGYPFDTVKTIMQVQQHEASKRRPNRSIGDLSGSGKRFLSSSLVALPSNTNSRLQKSIKLELEQAKLISSRIYKHRGIPGFFKGFTLPFYSVIAMNSVAYPCYMIGRENFGDSLSAVALSGALSGLIASFITSPVELVKIRLQNGAAMPKGSLLPFTSTSQCLLNLIQKEGGLLALYRGWLATALRDIPGSAGYFLAYEGILRGFTAWSGPLNQPIEWHFLFATGFASSLINWLLVLPLDNIKTRIQLNGNKPFKPHEHSSLRDFLTREWKALWTRPPVNGSAIRHSTGWLMLVLRSVPANFACWAGYVATLKILEAQQESQ